MPATSDEGFHGKTYSTLSRKKTSESLYAIRNVSFINDAETCKHEELNVRGRSFNIKVK